MKIMITEEEYLKAKKITQEYECEHLNISGVIKSVCTHPKGCLLIRGENKPHRCTLCGELVEQTVL